MSSKVLLPVQNSNSDVLFPTNVVSGMSGSKPKSSSGKQRRLPNIDGLFEKKKSDDEQPQMFLRCRYCPEISSEKDEDDFEF